ncbi:hypothetical protein WH52_08790 [Tenacibaculum holothuriorum]|uniref:Lipoprotein n=1 Tax=Tenacibaculum holothuriorum TaxID=1635173 RepID=A0A1Y2PEK5_9FLAO|nr:hypothetical protein [Tenacibaculum holothuriorum]OSY88108.1 hypothetical protein WH52_08790 [Tenacibaculum holothuriorum]
MKKLTPFFLCLSLILASCSSNESEILNNQPEEKLLKSYTLKRDATGAYSIDFNVDNQTDVATFKGNDNTNDIVLSKNSVATKTAYSNDFSVENDQLKIGFIEANGNKKTKIFVEDDDIKLAKSNSVTEFLNSYSITSNGNGTYQLDFKVNDNVQTEFIYNEDKNVYEVHLSVGKSKEKNFSRHFELNESDILKINFVNHKNSMSRGTASREDVEEKPRVSIGTAEPEAV